MSVNKFGQSAKDSDWAGQKGDRGVGFLLTGDGHFDIQNRRLTNVSTPLHPNDVATLTQLTEIRDDTMRDFAAKAEVQDEAINALMLENDNYVAKKKRIKELAVPH